MIADLAEIDRVTVWQILHDQFNMRSVCVRMVPKILTPEQKEKHKTICSYILEQIQEQPDFLNSVVTWGNLDFSIWPWKKVTIGALEDAHCIEEQKSSNEPVKWRQCWLFFSTWRAWSWLSGFLMARTPTKSTTSRFWPSFRKEWEKRGWIKMPNRNGQYCFEQWKNWMQHCVDRAGEYTEEDKS